MNPSEHEFLRVEENWWYGPSLEVYLDFRDPDVFPLADTKLAEFADRLALDGPYAAIDHVGVTDKRLRRLERGPRAFGVWALDESTRVGVKLLSGPGACADLLLSVPPRHVKRAGFIYPWSVAGWRVTDDVVALHRRIVERLQRLHEFVPLRAALIQDEGWVFPFDSSENGIVMARDVAAHFGVTPDPACETACVPWPS